MKHRQNILATTIGLLKMLGPKLSFLISLAIINGTLSELAGIGTVLFGALGIAGAMGTAISLPPSWLMALAVLSGLARGLLRYLEQYLNHYIAFTLLANVRKKTYAALARLAPAKLEGEKKGNIIAMVTADTETLEVFYAHTISPIFIALNTLLLVTLLVGFISSWLIAAIFAGFYLVIGLLLPWLAFAWQAPVARQYRTATGDFSGRYLDALKGSAEIVFARQEKAKTAEIAAESTRLSRLTQRLKWRGAIIDNLVILLWGIAIIVVVYAGISEHLTGALDIGLAVFGLAVTMAAFRPAIALAALPSALTGSYASAQRLLTLIAEEPAIVENTTGAELKIIERATAQKVGFVYPDDENKVLADVSLSLPHKGIIALTGESGAGKSTLLKLFMRHYDPVVGVIAYNEKDARTIQTPQLRQKVAIMDQQTYLFYESIADNLREAKPAASEAQLWAALGKAAALDYVRSLPHGLAEIIDPDADNISSGERQRLGLARLFLREPALVLLDEPTSNVDSLNEKMMLEAIVEQGKKTCVLLVSHRQSTVKAATKIYRLADGHLNKEGGLSQS